MNTDQQQSYSRLRFNYHPVLIEIMSNRGLEPVDRPTHLVGPDATLDEVIEHTEWFTWSGDSLRPYRYRRYYQVLNQHVEVPKGRVAHIDIGCGAGLFSWAFLDWAMDNRVPLDRVDLYGMDHSPAMLELAELVRSGLTRHIPDYPELRYVHSIESLRDQLGSPTDTDYILTFGHSLAQITHHFPSDVSRYAQFIAHVRKTVDSQARCVLIAADARNQRAKTNLSLGWNQLLSSLRAAGIQYEHEPLEWSGPQINDSDCVKLAKLYVN